MSHVAPMSPAYRKLIRPLPDQLGADPVNPYRETYEQLNAEFEALKASAAYHRDPAVRRELEEARERLSAYIEKHDTKIFGVRTAEAANPWVPPKGKDLVRAYHSHPVTGARVYDYGEPSAEKPTAPKSRRTRTVSCLQCATKHAIPVTARSTYCSDRCRKAAKRDRMARSRATEKWKAKRLAA